MKAIILASGIGKRLHPLTKKIPKPLLKINDKTLIEWQIDNLVKCKIQNIVITTGLFENNLIRFLKEKYRETNIIYVNNPQYDTTNYIYSLWLTKDYIDDDIVLLHGDLVFDQILLKKLIDEEGNLVLVNREVNVPKKDFKAVIEKNKIVKIGVDFFTKKSYLTMPLYKFLKKDFLIWMDEIEKEVKDGNLNIYAEEVFNNISNLIILKPLYFTKELCMEIDTIHDLKKARELINNYNKL
jgi:phosphoenolpyruvate phosphomutase